MHDNIHVETFYGPQWGTGDLDIETPLTFLLSTLFVHMKISLEIKSNIE